jgi:F-type H+-transporting ATPase subunit delta
MTVSSNAAAGAVLADAPYSDVHFVWSTFIAQLVAFVIIVALIVKYVVPPVRRMMTKRQDTVRTQIAESEAAAARLTEARRAFEQAVDEAHKESAKIREDARADALQITEQLRAQADAEVARVSQHGREQVALARAQLIRELKADLGTAALAQADRQVREHLSSTQAKADSVDRFLDELEAMAGAGNTGSGKNGKN